MKQPMAYEGTYPRLWAGYFFKESLGAGKGVHTGVDYNHGRDDPGDPIYAITGGKVVARKNNGQISGFGNAIIIESACPPTVRGNRLYHRYLHMNTVEVSVGQTLIEGQRIGTVGTTGGVPAHLHLDTWTDRNGLGVHWNYDKFTPLSSYEDPYRLIENNKNWTQGEEMFRTDEEVQEAYLLLRGSPGTLSERSGWIGQTKQRFFQVGRTEADSIRKQLADVKLALENLQKQPPKEIVKIVKEIVEVPVERITIKEVEVIKEPTWLKTAVDFIRSVLRIK